MNRIVFEATSEEEIVKELKKKHTAHVYKRLMALKLKMVDQLTNVQAGKLVGLHETSVSRLIQRYKAEGIEAIIGIRHNHGKRYMTREEEVAFLAKYKLESESGHVVEVGEIHRAYEETVGHPVTRNAIYYLLHKHGWRKVMPRSKHPKKASDEAIAAYKKNHGNNPKSEKGAAKTPSDVSGRGWIWTNQQA